VDLVLQTITVTIVLSIVAHGVTARPLTGLYLRATGTPRRVLPHER
jgi:hypothetical protein